MLKIFQHFVKYYNCLLSAKTEGLCRPHEHLHQNIQSAMEMEKGDHLPSLDTDIYRRTDGCLSHRIYGKITQTNLCLSTRSHHHLANKQAVLFTLAHQAKAICNWDISLLN
jgi:hypothetical protein